MLFRDAIINRYDRLNRNGIRPIACTGSIISRTDLQGARGSFNARIGVSIIAISFIRLFFREPFYQPLARPSTITDCSRDGHRAITPAAWKSKHALIVRNHQPFCGQPVVSTRFIDTENN